MTSKTHLCLHHYSCSENVVRSFSRTFINLFGIKVVANNLFYLGNPKKLLKNLTSSKSMKDNLMFALWLALVNSTYKFVLCALRRIFKDNDKISAPIAGFIAGLFSLIEAKSRRQFITVLMLSRALDSHARLMIDKNYIKEIPHFNVFLAMLCFIV